MYDSLYVHARCTKSTKEEEKIASMAFFVSKKKIIIANKFKSVKIIES